MPQVEVSCTVRNCHYWAEGEHCTAEKILITTDHIGQRYGESLDAGDAGRLARAHGATDAAGCADTCCKTFTAADPQQPAGTADKMMAKAHQLAGKH